MKIYGRRKVLNGEEIINFFKEQKIDNLTNPEELHVTEIYSKEDVDPDTLDFDKNNFTYIPNNPHIELFGTYLVLVVDTPFLQKRFDYFKNMGCSWDYPTYNPHISLCDEFTGDISNIVPYKNVIKLGPEIYTNLDDK